MGLYQLPKVYHPDFRSPRIKPIGNVVLDYSHPANKGVILTVLADDTLGRDISHGVIPSSFGATLGSNLSGREWVFAGADPLIQYPPDERYNVTGNLSALFGVTVNTVSSGSEIICSIDAGSGETIQENTLLFLAANLGSAGDFDYIHEHDAGSNQRVTLNNFFTVGERVIVAVVRDALVKTVKIYKNGFLQTTFNYINAPDNAGGVAGISLGERINSVTPFDGAIDFFHITSEAWSDALVKSLSNNMYQILKPAIPPSYFVPEAVGGVTASLLLLQQSFRQ